MEERTASIPFFVHEGEMTRMERTNKRLGYDMSNITFIKGETGWIIYEKQFAEEEYTVSVQQDTDGGGDNTFSGNTLKLIGGDDYGETDGDHNGPETGADPN